MGLIVSSNGSGYTTAAKVRNYAGIPSTTDVSDTDLNTLIVYASRQLSRDITTRVFNERLSGNIDGSNTKFIAKHPYLADRNLDVAVNGSDVVVRSGTFETDGTITRATLTVTSVDATRGAVTLNAAPATTVDFIEMDYEYYNCPVYTDQLEQAANALAAHYVYVRNKDPSRVTLSQLKGGSGDGVRWRYGSIAGSFGSKWYDEYQRLVTQIRMGEVIGSERLTDPNAGALSDDQIER